MTQILPMLAARASKSYIEEALDDSNRVAELKYDGARYILSNMGGTFTLTSRRISKKTGELAEKAQSIPHICQLIKEPGITLDGEMTVANAHGTSSDVMSILNCKPAEAIRRQMAQGWLVYTAWDILDYQGESIRHLPLSERRLILNSLYVRMCPLKWKKSDCKVYSQELDHIKLAVQTPFKRVLLARANKENLEGIILKDIRSPYIENDRHKENWLKVKKVQDYDVVIMGFTKPRPMTTKVSGETSESKLYKNGWIGAVIYGAYNAFGCLVEVGRFAGMKDSLRADMSAHPKKYIGQVAEIRGHEFRVDGIFLPRFSRMRPDKEPKACTVNDLKSTDRDYTYE